jgi:hypothetical protein
LAATGKVTKSALRMPLTIMTKPNIRHASKKAPHRKDAGLFYQAKTGSLSCQH